MPFDLLFTKLIDACDVTSDPRILKSAIGRIVKASGFERFAYLHLGSAQSVVISDYPEEWQTRYLDRCYSRIDPIVLKARLHMRAFTWSGDCDRQRMTVEQRTFHDEAADFGIRSGISIPVRAGFGNIAILTLASAEPFERFDFDRRTAVTAAAMVHSRLPQGSNALNKEIMLNNREASCLRWWSEGKTMQEIAVVEGIKFGTVRYYLDRARVKLGAITLGQATAIATRLALI